MVNEKLISFDGPWRRKLAEHKNFDDDFILRLIFDVPPLRDALLGGIAGGSIPAAPSPHMTPIRQQRDIFREYLEAKNGREEWRKYRKRKADGLVAPLVAVANGLDRHDAARALRLARTGDDGFFALIKIGLAIMAVAADIGLPSDADLLEDGKSVMPDLFEAPKKDAGKRPSSDDDDYSEGFEGSFS